jgi:hypothetical protein
MTITRLGKCCDNDDSRQLDIYFFNYNKTLVVDFNYISCHINNNFVYSLIFFSYSRALRI